MNEPAGEFEAPVTITAFPERLFIGWPTCHGKNRSRGAECQSPIAHTREQICSARNRGHYYGGCFQGKNFVSLLGCLCSLTGRVSREGCRSGRIGNLARAAQRPTDGGARRDPFTDGLDAFVAHVQVSADSHNTRIELLGTNCQQRPIGADFRFGKQDREPETLDLYRKCPGSQISSESGV